MPLILWIKYINGNETWFNIILNLNVRIPTGHLWKSQGLPWDKLGPGERIGNCLRNHEKCYECYHYWRSFAFRNGLPRSCPLFPKKIYGPVRDDSTLRCSQTNPPLRSLQTNYHSRYLNSNYSSGLKLWRLAWFLFKLWDKLQVCDDMTTTIRRPYWWRHLPAVCLSVGITFAFPFNRGPVSTSWQCRPGPYSYSSSGGGITGKTLTFHFHGCSRDRKLIQMSVSLINKRLLLLINAL